MLGASVIVSAILVGLVIYAPGLREPFGTEALGLAEVAVVLGFALVPAAVVELVKAVRRRRLRASQPGGSGAET